MLQQPAGDYGIPLQALFHDPMFAARHPWLVRNWLTRSWQTPFATALCMILIPSLSMVRNSCANEKASTNKGILALSGPEIYRFEVSKESNAGWCNETEKGSNVGSITLPANHLYGVYVASQRFTILHYG